MTTDRPDGERASRHRYRITPAMAEIWDGVVRELLPDNSVLDVAGLERDWLLLGHRVAVGLAKENAPQAVGELVGVDLIASRAAGARRIAYGRIKQWMDAHAPKLASLFVEAREQDVDPHDLLAALRFFADPPPADRRQGRPDVPGDAEQTP